MATKLREALAQLPYLARALVLVWQAAHRWTIAWLIILIVQGLLPAAIVSLTRVLVDRLVAVIDSGGDPEIIKPTLELAIIMGVLLILTQLLSSLSRWIRSVQVELVQDYVISLVHQQSTVLDLGFYDSHEYYDHLHRARNEAHYRPVNLLENLGNLLQNSITLVAMIAVLIPYGIWLPLALLLSTLPALAVVLRHSQHEYSWRQRTTPDRRRTRYYATMITAREAAAELRLFDLGAHFQSGYQKIRHRLRLEYLTLIRRQALAQLGASSMALLVTAGVMLWAVWQAMQGLLTLGDLALLYEAFNYGQRLMRSLLESAGQIYSNSLFLGNLFEFLALKPQVIDPVEAEKVPSLIQEGIVFQDVGFYYPGSDRPVLHDFNLLIPAGQIAAIVGANGAGKSTLLKLLCRFYDPQFGRVELDGVDLRDLSLEELRRSITVLFQQPVPYQDSVAENIALGDLVAEPDRQTIETAARAAGADAVVSKLPNGYDALLGRWFKGGNDLSVGEWQRIALARAYLRRASIIVLDEPTGAMDPWAETEWLKRFRGLAEGRTSIIITHRFTTARYADAIHVMDDGHIIESGTHIELLAIGGRYAQCWSEQIVHRPDVTDHIPEFGKTPR